MFARTAAADAGESLTDPEPWRKSGEPAGTRLAAERHARCLASWLKYSDYERERVGVGGGSRGRGTIERNISEGGFFQGVIPLRFIVTRRSLEFILLGSFETDRSSFEEKFCYLLFHFRRASGSKISCAILQRRMGD